MNAIVKKPQFVLWLAVLIQLPIQLFFTIWAGGFFGGIAFSATGSKHPAIFIVIGALAFVVIPCVTILGKKLSYERTEYSFYLDHVEVTEGFFSRQMKSVAYTDIREVTLRRGLFQRSCGLGTIYLGTLATGSARQSNPFSAFGFDSASASGVTVRDLPEPDAAYAEIRNRIEAAKSASARVSQL